MNERLTAFLVNLATDPDKLQQFARDPASVLDATELTPEDKAAVLSQDTAVIREAMGYSHADHLTQQATMPKRGRKRGKKTGAAKKRATAAKKRATGAKKRATGAKKRATGAKAKGGRKSPRGGKKR